MFESKLGSGLGLSLLVIVSVFATVESKCSKGCDLALASYYVWAGSNLTFISELMSNSISDILSYNRQVPSQYSLPSDKRINIPFSCDCINGEFLGHVFKYAIGSGDTYEKVAALYYANLTTMGWIKRFNSPDPNRIPDNLQLNVTVNCSCGDGSEANGLVITYPLRPGESLESIAAEMNLTTDSLLRYNPNSDFSAGTGRVYIPGKGLSGGDIAGIVIASAVVGALLLAVCIYVGFKRKNKVQGRQNIAFS